MGSAARSGKMKTTLLVGLVCVALAEDKVGPSLSPSTTSIKIRQEAPAKSKSNILNTFRPIISKLTPDTQNKVLIARADSEHGVSPQQTLAKVIQHNASDSPYARTVVIQNTKQAFRAFGVKNVPQHIIQRWNRYRRRTQSSTKQEEEEEEDKSNDEVIDEVF